ncbi:hypothetical protein EJ08DRAFT_657671 [Tothia fuscella]|uniref:Uncharacterized protein n=1 Tax=Tothia fuscella TaxID=1048955 RepID=A0A9P4U1X6_9PEZI|nr:hypothetical protein EJ08DRAFT_657671 [Tothia fuscella]
MPLIQIHPQKQTAELENEKPSKVRDEHPHIVLRLLDDIMTLRKAVQQLENQFGQAKESLKVCQDRVIELERENDRLETMMRSTSEQMVYDFNVLRKSLGEYYEEESSDEDDFKTM